MRGPTPLELEAIRQCAPGLDTLWDDGDPVADAADTAAEAGWMDRKEVCWIDDDGLEWSQECYDTNEQGLLVLRIMGAR
jgi:hypothetical protein